MLFFPTTAIIIDDKKQFLETLEFSLRNTNHALKYFSNTDKAIEFIDIRKTKNSVFKNVNNFSDHYATSYFEEVILPIIKDESRYDIVTCVISDYHMKKINGLEFLSKIMSPIYKVMLTAVLPDKEGIESLNSDKIDQFLRKDDLRLREKLLNIFLKSESRFFESYNFGKNNNKINDLLSFLQKKYGALEIYRVSYENIFLLIDGSGSEFVAHIFNDTSLQEQFKESESYNISYEAREGINKKFHAHCSFDFDEEKANQSAKDWISYLRKIEYFKELELYYHVTPLGKNHYSAGSFNGRMSDRNSFYI